MKVLIVHNHHPDPKQRKTRVGYSPQDPVLALQILSLGLSTLSSAVQAKEAEEKSLIAKPNAKGLKLAEDSRLRGS